jgi:hypothetical protein
MSLCHTCAYYKNDERAAKVCGGYMGVQGHWITQHAGIGQWTDRYPIRSHLPITKCPHHTTLLAELTRLLPMLEWL